MRFESLEEAQAYLDRWEQRWADTRVLTPYYSFDPVYILLYCFDSTLRIVQLALNTSERGKNFLLNGHCFWRASHSFVLWPHHTPILAWGGTFHIHFGRAENQTVHFPDTNTALTYTCSLPEGPRHEHGIPRPPRNATGNWKECCLPPCNPADFRPYEETLREWPISQRYRSRK
jgi:hypothetical protein